MNLKVVVLKGPWWRRGISQVFGPLLAVVYLLRPGSASVGSFQWMIWPERESKIDGGKFAYREGSVKVDRGQQGQVVKEEDVAESGDVLRLMLLPKAFSAEFREGWEKWRDGYWGKENARRADLRKVVQRKEKEKAKEQGGLLWWTGWRGWARFFGETLPQTSSTATREKPLRQNSSRRSSTSRDGSIPARKTSRTTSIIHEENNSRSSSRSTDTDASRPRAGSATRAKRASSSRISTIPSTTRQTRSARASTEEGDEDELGGNVDAKMKDAKDRDISPHSRDSDVKIEKTPTSRLRQKESVSNMSDVSTASDSDFGSVKDGGGKGDGVV